MRYPTIYATICQTNMAEKKNKNNKKRQSGSTPKEIFLQFGRQILITLLLIFLLISSYSAITEKITETPETSVSQLAVDIKSGVVTKIVTEGDDLTVTYKDDSKKRTKKEI